ncbi:NUDIX hydrolase [Azotosporobacter soli]|uniref:NUDIX hydrolase n=1 Tax=Azotosporobacter soli TaxID=3055040 RepID=UPI0031FEEB26
MKKSISLTETLVSSSSVFKGALLDVYCDTVTLPNGRQATREFIKHPGAVAVVPFTENGDVLMVRQFRYPTGCELLEIPAGKLDPGEQPEDCAKRELAEETGFRPGRLCRLASIHTTPGFSDEVIHLYRAENLIACDAVPDEDEFLQVESYSPTELKQMITAGEITDAKTITALMLAI